MNCPVCSKEMTKRSSYGAVEFDICGDHGIWLDKGELRRLVDAAAEDGREGQAIVADERRSGRIQGSILGLWSLLLP